MNKANKIFSILEECSDRVADIKPGETIKCSHNVQVVSGELKKFKKNMKEKGFNVETKYEKKIMSVNMHGRGSYDYIYTYQGVTYISLPSH